MLGYNISKLRKENNISQEALAKILGVNWQTISLWEDGDAVPTLEQIVALANILGVSTDALLKDSFKKEISNTKKYKFKTKHSIRRSIFILFAVLLSSVVVATVILIIKYLPQNDTALSAKEIFNRTAPSTVEIHSLSVDSSNIGTGFFIDNEGTIITNYHVIDGCLDADIVLQDGTEYSVMSILGYDANLDIAILSTTCMQSTPVEYREEAIFTGEKVYTLGSSLGLTGTFTEGIISSANRKIHGKNFIQTTAPISSGNSGGPLVDQDGKVVGITTSAFEEGQNLNLAVPIILAINIERDSHIGSLKRIFMEQYSEEIDPIAMLVIELTIDSYIENPNDETRAYLREQLGMDAQQ